MSLTIDGTSTTVSIIKLLHGRDALWVRYDARTMASVLQHVRASSFSQQAHHYKTLNDDLPEGPRIRNRKKGFLMGVGARSDVLSVLAAGDDEARPYKAQSADAEVGEDETQRAAELDTEAEGEPTHAVPGSRPQELVIALG